jgi:Lrp/AsnC family leucine-responsive transcriptional regulator
MTEKLDDTDLMILRELRENCKQPVKELAKSLRIHPNTLLQRIKKLEKQKVIIKYTAEVDFRKLGYDLHAIIMGEVRKGRAGDQAQLAEITKMPQVQYLYAVTGAYDVILSVRVRNRDELVSVLGKIGEHPIVEKTMTHMVLFSYKHPYEFNPLL